MELSPKQQTVEQIKKAKRILIMGHKTPEGDILGSALALSAALESLGKTCEVTVTDKIPTVYKFLPHIKKINPELKLTDGKIIRLDLAKFPVSGMKYQKTKEYLDIILDSDKNLKFEFIDVVNGTPKPDIIIVLDTPDVDKIDGAYDANTELFFEVPVINIDHHPGNEYYGAINLVDLTATSTAEILVSLFEALGVKISDPDMATCLLCGIISDTGSFRSGNTTPKSLTVAAQLLAAGARQQEIITNLYKKRPMALLKLWGEMLAGISEDKNHHFAWTKVQLSDVANNGITTSDVLDAADELLQNTPDAEIILILCAKEDGEIIGKIKGAKGTNIMPIANLFEGEGTSTNANFKFKSKNLAEAELQILKRIHDFWGETGANDNKEVWDVIEKEKDANNSDEKPEEKLSVPKTEEELEETEVLDVPKTEKEKEETEEELSKPQSEEEIEETTETQTKKDFEEVIKKHDDDENVIDHALESLAKNQKNKKSSFSRIGEVIEIRHEDKLLTKKEKSKDESQNLGKDGEIDVFDEDES